MDLSDRGWQRRANEAAKALTARRPAEALTLLGASPRGAHALRIKALALCALGRPGTEDAVRAAALAGAPLGELLLAQAAMHRRAGRHDAALAASDRAATSPQPPRPSLVQAARASSLAALGRTEEACRAYEAALADDPCSQVALIGYGGHLNALDRPAEAAAVLDEALRAKRSAAALNNRAGAARRLGAAAEELSLLREASQVAPANPDVLANRARAAARAGEVDEATTAFLAAVDAAPGRPDIHTDLARHLWETGRAAQAFVSIDAVSDRVPPPALARLQTEAGQLALKAGLVDKARDRFEAALKVAPRLSAARAGRAETSSGTARAVAWRAAYEADAQAPAIRLGYAWHLLRDGGDPLEAEGVLAAPVPGEFEQARLAYDGVAARLLGRPRYREHHDPDVLARAVQIEPPPGESLPAFLRRVEETLEACFSSLTTAPIDQTVFGGRQSRGDLWATSDPVLLALRAAMLRAANQYWRELDVAADHPLARHFPGGPSRGRVVPGAAWAIMLTSGGGHTDHFHARGLLSSAHYVRVPPAVAPSGGTDAGGRPGWLRLGRPNTDRADLPPERFVRPEPGMIVLFPSYLWHGVEPFEGEGTRLTTPSDYVARRPAG